jgi:hypothetical protein
MAIGVVVCIATCTTGTSAEEDLLPHPVDNPRSTLMLDLPGSGTDPEGIDFARLPRLAGKHAVVSQGDPQWKFRLHNYLAHHDGRYWCIWSHGPVIEDKARQHIQYATSRDGLQWSEPRVLTGPPREGYGYIARGLWIRDGQLIALASLYEAPAFHDGDLELDAFAWNPQQAAWQPLGMVYDDTLNNFAPKRLPDGPWMMTRRNAKRQMSVMLGGVKSLNDWEVLPLTTYQREDGARPEEPFWWILPDGNLVGLFRDNGGSKRLLRAFSTDNGRHFSQPVVTNFPDARSKFNALRTSRGDFVMVSNPNPRGRNPLCLSTSADGLVFRQMFVLPIEEKGTLQYPHVIQHGDHLLIAFSRNKTSIEVLRIPLSEIPLR